MQDANLIFQVASQTLLFALLNRQRALIFLLTFAGKDLHVDYGAVDSRRGNQRSVFHVGGLLTKDCAQQLLFSGQLRLALGRDFAHQNRSGFDLSADANDAALVQIAQHVFADVRDVASDFFRPQLCVTRFDLELLDVNRGVIVLFHQSL